MPSREHTIKADSTHPGASFVVAVAATATDQRDVTFVENHGVVVAAIIPAQNYHPPNECCCSNCPWNGNHEGPVNRSS